MTSDNHNQWDDIREEIILLCIQWYLTDNLSYSQLKIIMSQRGFRIDPRTINYLINEYSPLALKRAKETRRYSRRGWRVAQIPFKLRGRRKYLYRALDAQGNTLDFLITNIRSKERAKNFFLQTIAENPEINQEKVLNKKQLFQINKKYLLWSLISMFVFLGIGFLSFKIVSNRLITPQDSPASLDDFQ